MKTAWFPISWRTPRLPLMAAAFGLCLAVQAIAAGPVAAVDNPSGGSSDDRSQMAADCAGAGGAYFDSIQGVEGGEHLYGCQHEDSVTVCDDRIAGGGCVNHVNEEAMRDPGAADPVGRGGGIVFDGPQDALEPDDTSQPPGQRWPDPPSLPATEVMR